MSIPKIDFSAFSPGIFNAISGMVRPATAREKELDRQAARLKMINRTFEKDFTTIEEADAFMDMKNRECAAKSGNIKDILNLSK